MLDVLVADVDFVALTSRLVSLNLVVRARVEFVVERFVRSGWFDPGIEHGSRWAIGKKAK